MIFFYIFLFFYYFSEQHKVRWVEFPLPIIILIFQQNLWGIGPPLCCSVLTRYPQLTNDCNFTWFMVSIESLPNFHFPTSKATLIRRQGLKESKRAKIYIHLFMKIYIKIIKLSNKLHLKEFIVIRGTHVTTNACFKTDEMIVTHRCM